MHDGTESHKSDKKPAKNGLERQEKPGIAEIEGQNSAQVEQKPKKDARGRWLPGVSGNPSGKGARKKRLTSILKELLATQPDPTHPGRTVADEIMAAAVREAKRGNFQFFKEIFERIEGKVPDRVMAAVDANWEMKFDDSEEEDEEGVNGDAAEKPADDDAPS